MLCAINSPKSPSRKVPSHTWLGENRCVCWCLCVRSSACCVLPVPDQDECAVCSPPQAVAQVMIQSFQLSSCALFNAQMQDVSPHPPFLSVTGPYLGVLEVKNDTCKHGRCYCFSECCHHCVCAVVLSYSPAQYFSSTSPHLVFLYFIWYWYASN